jgi:CRISPR-associated endonuclease/helicase Cas3
LALLKPPPFPDLKAPAFDRLAWFLAGLAVAADWVGSGRRWFPRVVAAEHTDLHRYWSDMALPRAGQAAREAHLIPSPVSMEGGLVHLFPGYSARPLPHWAEMVAIPEGPATAGNHPNWQFCRG